MGIIADWLAIHFNKTEFRGDAQQSCDIAPLIGRRRGKDWLYLALAAPNLAVGVAQIAMVDLETMFSVIAPLLPLIAIAIGFVPGYWPQVLVATLYINGVIPFAAPIGNTISNDGDALFPAIALNPKAALVATLYSTVPALIVAYAFHFFAPDFMN